MGKYGGIDTEPERRTEMGDMGQGSSYENPSPFESAEAVLIMTVFELPFRLLVLLVMPA
jgi:hypothetical protein